MVRDHSKVVGESSEGDAGVLGEGACGGWHGEMA
jgi:hypothetical protein